MASNEDTQPVAIGPQPSQVTDTERLQKLNTDLENIPLFMTHLPTDDTNPAVEALKSLISEEAPEDMAQKFKTEGNTSFHRKRYDQAVAHYTHALSFDHDNNELKVSLFTNRAAANLELHNYARVLEDCKSALQIKSNTPKALFRAARACIMVGKFDEADECCEWALRLDPESKELRKMQDDVKEARRALEVREKEQEKRENARLEKREMVQQAIAIRSGLTFDLSPDNMKKRDLYAWEVSEHCVELDPESAHLLWPVVFLYPESKESDFVQQFDEATSLYDMLATVLAQPPPWDNQQRPAYTVDSVDTYFLARPLGGMEKDERLVKVKSTMRLATILENPKYNILDGIPSFLVLPKSSPFTDQFIEHYRQQRLANDSAITKSDK
ncbi:HSP70/90 co-chaperone [Coemansia sp. RSA 2167]|nr:HSP70/90 co-chaperone [Coemansia sp. RSA 1591]KAJ1760671.1 HSP70/90 co-chaperone [Coemansia sp. RSA 1752]KAJ1787285.1 HSP70/90 co-chaperone [Coemansia sp. RSA 1938]KAJ1787839.1 HSP70/90 co-chaperone [Coemansia sp. RSA 2167]KAJ2174587.1 HSP70/90 co-chaperone [Coemansia sp. RSA 560]KAJ2182196.1 HSP70/90 co-chaperone [Coemansia sp. RSA 551]KAJ2185535.1 HSP70/90 co-chaperone [Coemansia sp. RSA 532]KAJ2224587.1 HSP70/90 co-chaperone [Coemansia sp. RSA 518]KAJ2271283.1 HSP70/90 co-chaperone [C